MCKRPLSMQTSPARNGKLDGKGGRMCGMETREAMGYGLISEVCMYDLYIVLPECSLCLYCGRMHICKYRNRKKNIYIYIY